MRTIPIRRMWTGGEVPRQFDAVIDCGLFHTFSDEERPAYVAGLRPPRRLSGA